MELFHVEDFDSKGESIQTASEDMGGRIKWRVYKGKPRVLESEADATEAQVETHNRTTELQAQAAAVDTLKTDPGWFEREADKTPFFGLAEIRASYEETLRRLATIAQSIGVFDQGE